MPGCGCIRSEEKRPLFLTGQRLPHQQRAANRGTQSVLGGGSDLCTPAGRRGLPSLSAGLIHHVFPRTAVLQFRVCEPPSTCGDSDQYVRPGATHPERAGRELLEDVEVYGWYGFSGGTPKCIAPSQAVWIDRTIHIEYT